MKYYTFGNNFPNGGGGGDRWSGVRFWLTTMLVFWAFSAIGLGWLVNSFFILIGFITVVPVVAFLGLQCPNCGEPLQEQKNKFVRLTPPGTIDVDVQVVE